MSNDKKVILLLADTVALLGGESEIVSFIRGLQGLDITPEHIENVKQYNTNKLQEVNDRLTLFVH